MKNKIVEAFKTYIQILRDGNNRDRFIAWLIIVLLFLFIGNGIWQQISPNKEQYITTSEFVQQLDAGNVAELHISNSDGTVNGTLNTATEEGILNFSSHVPEKSETFTEKYLASTGAEWDYSKQPAWISTLSTLLLYVIQIALIGGLFIILFRAQTGSGGFAGLLGGDEDDFVTDIPNVSFDDVAGIPEAIEEVSELVTFLKSPDVYDAAGAKCPRGILLEGDPGCGKTLLARALAGEAGVNFIATSGSDFVKLYVGQGARKVRELFTLARKNQPAIVFIDEIDAVGGNRDGGTGMHDEYLQTINALLKEMDGFKQNDHVIVMAATNRSSSLDPALIRPGRFDRIITVDTPAKDGRIAILKHYAQGRPFAELVDFDRLAKHTYGFSGAELESVINQAATLAARRATAEGTSPMITKEDLDEGISRVLSGPAMKSKKLSDEEKRQVAYHEAGHAIVQYLLPECDPVQKISIVSRRIPRVGMALGYVQSYSETDSYVTTSSKLHAELASLMAGRCSETINCGIESAGASDDLRKASKIAYDMVDRYAFKSPSGEQESWRVEVASSNGFSKSSEARLRQIDERVENILNRAYETSKRIVTQHRHEIDGIVKVLLEEETIDSERIGEIIEKAAEERKLIEEA